MREAYAEVFDHDIPFVQFSKSTDGKYFCIDARKRGNIARFIRHSCEPNAVIKAVCIS